MLRRIELEVLATVERGVTISELATTLDHSESYLSRGVGSLEQKGLIYTERDGRRKRLVPSDARAVACYQDLVRQHTHIDFPALLTGKSLEVVYHLDQPRTVTEIADRSDNYRNTVNRILKRFRDRGLVGNDNGRYAFNADFDALHEFARELAHHLHRHRLESIASKGTILWESYDEFLAQVDREIDVAGFHETGLARFAAFDLQFLLTGHRYYVYSEELDEITPEDLCVHTLVIDDGSRHRSYCLLLLSHVDVDEERLRERAVHFDLEDLIDTMLRYLETHGAVDTDRLPPWDEFQALAAEYEVNLPP